MERKSRVPKVFRRITNFVMSHKALVIPIAIVGVAAGLFALTANAASFVSVPNGTVATGSWAVSGAATRHEAVDEGVTANTVDYVQAPSGVDVTTLNLETTSPTSVDSATQLQLHINSRIQTVGGGTADDIVARIMIGGTQVATGTITPSTSAYGWQSVVTVSGTWTQANVDSMRVELDRVVQGGGNPTRRIDDLRIASVYVDVTYSQAALFDQSSYRWFDSQDSTDDPTFVTTLGGSAADLGRSVIQTSDGGYAVGGYTNGYGAGSDDVLLSKYDSGGGLMWSRTWGGTANDRAYSMIQTSDGGFALTGYTFSYGSGNDDAFLIKYTSSGTLSFSRTWGGIGSEYADGVIQTSDGGYAVTGTTSSYGAGGQDMFLAKYNSFGTLSWSRTWGGAGADTGYSLAQTSDGGYAVTGATSTYGAGGSDTILVKYTSTGTLSWSRTWGGAAADVGWSVIQSSDGGYVIGGASESFDVGAALIKYDSSGTLSWSRVWSGVAADFGQSVVQSSDGGYALSGYTTSYGAGSNDSFLAKYTSTGTLSWSRTWGGGNQDYGIGLTSTSDGGFATTGFTTSYGAGGNEVFLAKYNSSGDITNCSSPMCQSPSATSNSPSATTTSPSATSNSPSVSTSSPTPSTSSPSPTQTVLVAVSGLIDVGAPLAASNTATIAPTAGTPFRLRMNVHVSTAQAGPGSANFKLQYAPQGNDDACDPSFIGETFSDMSPSGGPIRFYNNPTASDRYGLVTNANDPTHGSDNLVRQTYEESNNFTIANAIPAGNDGMWDFSLVLDNSASQGSSYCIRAVTSTGATLNSYAQVPEIVAPVATLTQSNYRLYANADSTTPGAPLAAQDTATTVSPGSAVRLRQTLRLDGANLTTAKSLRLQYGEKITTCAAASFSDLNSTSSNTNITQGAFLSGGGTPFSNYTNVTADDGQYASFSVGPYSSTTSMLMTTSAYGFSVPGNATIQGIEVNLDTRSLTTARVEEIRLVRAGVNESYTKTTTSFSPGGVSSIGSPTDLWNASWSPADINDPSFGSRFNIFTTNSTPIPTVFDLDYVSMTVYYTLPLASSLSYYDNATTASGTSITANPNDPTDGSRTIVPVTYQEADPFALGTSTITPGQNALWDFSFQVDPAASPKTYCFRMAESNGTVLASYLRYPEVTISGGASGPTLDQQLRGGQAVVDGVKTPFTF